MVTKRKNTKKTSSITDRKNNVKVGRTASATSDKKLKKQVAQKKTATAKTGNIKSNTAVRAKNSVKTAKTNVTTSAAKKIINTIAFELLSEGIASGKALSRQAINRVISKHVDRLRSILTPISPNTDRHTKTNTAVKIAKTAKQTKQDGRAAKTGRQAKADKSSNSKKGTKKSTKNTVMAKSAKNRNQKTRISGIKEASLSINRDAKEASLSIKDTAKEATLSIKGTAPKVGIEAQA